MACRSFVFNFLRDKNKEKVNMENLNRHVCFPYRTLATIFVWDFP